MDSANTTVCRCGIITVSTTHREDTDLSGSVVNDALIAAGHEVVRRRWIDDQRSDIRELFAEWIGRSDLDVIIAIGGTGLGATDVTPEALAPLISKPMPGFGELLRMLAFHELGVHALESRACAAMCHRTLVYLVPGGPQAVDLAIHRLIIPQLSTVVAVERHRPSTIASIQPDLDKKERPSLLAGASPI